MNSRVALIDSCWIWLHRYLVDGVIDIDMNGNNRFLLIQHSQRQAVNPNLFLL